MASSEKQVRIIGIIPARYASTRFPGKPLALIEGISMIERVYRRASACEELTTVVVATDDTRIYDHVAGFGGKAVMTSAAHRSGTDRLGETIKILANDGFNYEIAVNIQGDEPFIQPRQISGVINLFRNPETQIATLVKQIESADDLFNPNVVKVVTDISGRALLFSRSPIPYFRGVSEKDWVTRHPYYKHIGIYAYRADTLEKLVLLRPAPPEETESLEQLRWLWHGYTVNTEITEFETIGIDSPEDLLKLTNIS